MATMREAGETPRTGGAEPAAFGPAPRREQLKGHASMLTSVTVHISGFVLYKDLVADTPATQMVATQLVIGALLLWLIAIATRQPLRLRGPLWRIVLLGSLAPVSIFMIMAFATVRTSATNATIIFGLVPVMLPVLGWLVLGERLRLSVMLGAMVAFSGIVLIVWRRAGLGSGDPFGDMLVFLAVMGVCATQLTGRRVNQHFSNAIMVTTYQVTVSAFIAIIIMLLVHPPDPFLPGSSGTTYGKLLYLGVASIVVNFLGYNYAMRRLPVGRTGLYVALSPAIGTILAVAFLGETVGWREVAGIFVVMSGVALPALLPQGLLSQALGRVAGRRGRPSGAPAPTEVEYKGDATHR